MKKGFAVLFCVLLLLQCGALAITGSAAASYASWEEAYKDFLINKAYLRKDSTQSTSDKNADHNVYIDSISGKQYFESIYHFANEPVERFDPYFCLYDMDKNGIPELLGYNNGAMAGSTFYCYTFQNGKIKYVGDVGFRSGRLWCSQAQAYPGLFYWSGNTGVMMGFYYYLENNQIQSIHVLTDYEKWNAQTEQAYWETVRETNDSKLYAAFYNQDRYIPTMGWAEILSIGWETFLLYCDISTIYCNDTAIQCSYLAEAANSTSSDGIRSKYTEYGFTNTVSHNYGALPIGPWEIPSASAACTFGYKKIQPISEYPGTGNTYDVILAVTTRGTTTISEGIGDVTKGGEKSFLTEKIYDNIYDYEEAVWNALTSYVNQYREIRNAEHLVILITGHSLGGAAANTVAARIDAGIRTGSVKWLRNARKDSVYAYTFGAIKVFPEEGNDVTPNLNDGYENIHNIYNYYDTYGPNGSEAAREVASIYDKYGHTDLFQKYYSESAILGTPYANHDMANYRKALQNHLVRCNGKDLQINTDHKGGSFWNILVKDVHQAIRTASDIGNAVISAIVTGFRSIANFISGLFGG